MSDILESVTGFVAQFKLDDGPWFDFGAAQVDEAAARKVADQAFEQHCKDLKKQPGYDSQVSGARIIHRRITDTIVENWVFSAPSPTPPITPSHKGGEA